MRIAFFDFDGTVTRKDSLIDFIQFSEGKTRYYIGLIILSPMLIAYILRLIPNHIAKENLIRYFLKGYDVEVFEELANRYSTEKIDQITYPKAMEQIALHQQQGDKVVIVSASMEYWLSSWCQKNNVELIATQMQVIEGKLTGKFSSKNCHGLEKVTRIKRSYDLSDYDYIYAYGDSRGDREMLALADESFYKHFAD